MTEEEKELLIEIKKIDAILDIFSAGGDLYANVAMQRQLNVILAKLKKAYPSVRYKQNIDSCKGCITNFLNEILPVRDRLIRHEKAEVTTEILIGSVEYNAQLVNESDPFNPQQDEVKEVKAVKKTYRKKK